MALAGGSKLDEREDVVETRLPDSKSRCYEVCCQSSEPEGDEYRIASPWHPALSRTDLLNPSDLFGHGPNAPIVKLR